MLGLNSNATKEEIRQAYKEVALVYHPDSNFFSEIVDQKQTNENEEIFQLLTCAYNTLMDKAKRKDYDKTMIFEFETWNEDVFEEEYYGDEEGYIESDSFSFSQLKYYHDNKNNPNAGFTVLKTTSNSEIKPTFEMFNKSRNSLIKFLKLFGL